MNQEKSRKKLYTDVVFVILAGLFLFMEIRSIQQKSIPMSYLDIRGFIFVVFLLVSFLFDLFNIRYTIKLIVGFCFFVTYCVLLYLG